MNQKTKQRSLAIIRMVVGLLLLIFLLRKLDLSSVVRALISIAPFYWLACVTLSMLGVVISCVKLQCLLNSFKIRMSLIRLLCIYLISSFWNNFLPGAVGGDIIKYSAIQKHATRRMDVAVSIFAERFSGMVLLLLFAAATAILNHELFPNTLIPVGMTFLAVSAAVSVLALRWLLPLVTEGNFAASRGWLRHFTHRMSLACREIIRNDRAMLTTFLVSLIFVINCIFIFQVLIIGMGFNLPFTQIGAVSCLIILVTWLPISLNGLGIREWGCIYFFGLCGIPSEKAMAISLLMYLATLTVSLLGGVIYMFDSRSRHKTLVDPPAPPAQRNDG